MIKELLFELLKKPIQAPADLYNFPADMTDMGSIIIIKSGTDYKHYFQVFSEGTLSYTKRKYGFKVKEMDLINQYPTTSRVVFAVSEINREPTNDDYVSNYFNPPDATEVSEREFFVTNCGLQDLMSLELIANHKFFLDYFLVETDQTILYLDKGRRLLVPLGENDPVDPRSGDKGQFIVPVVGSISYNIKDGEYQIPLKKVNPAVFGKSFLDLEDIKIEVHTLDSTVQIENNIFPIEVRFPNGEIKRYDSTQGTITFENLGELIFSLIILSR